MIGMVSKLLYCNSNQGYMKSNPNFLERRCYAEITIPPSFVLFTMFQCPFPDIEEAGAGLGGGEAGFSAGGGVAGFEGGEAGFAGSTLGGGGAGFGAGGWLLGFDPVGGLLLGCCLGRVRSWLWRLLRRFGWSRLCLFKCDLGCWWRDRI